MEITIKAFLASQLSADTQHKVCNDHRDILILEDPQWDEPILEGLKEELSPYGIEPDIKWSGFYSQGDGLSFTCDTIDTDLLIRKLYEDGHDIHEDIVLESKNMHVYSLPTRIYGQQAVHEKSVYFGINYEGEEDIDYLSVEKIINRWREAKCIEYHRKLEAYYEELTSDAMIIAKLDETDYLFTESGKRIYTS
jgi:hypothetical protein